MTSLSLQEAKCSMTLSRKKDKPVLSRDETTNLCFNNDCFLFGNLFNARSNEDL